MRGEKSGENGKYFRYVEKFLDMAYLKFSPFSPDFSPLFLEKSGTFFVWETSPGVPRAAFETLTGAISLYLGGAHTCSSALSAL
jgi:hypothetical protein